MTERGGDPRYKIVTALLLLTSAVAWLILWRGGFSPSARFDHEHMHHLAGVGLAMLAPFMAGWLVMIAAMMLPTTLPVARLFSSVTRERSDYALLMGLLLTGYMLVWAAFGFAVFGAFQAVLMPLRLFSAAARWAPALSAVSLVGAGAFQFTPLKYRCLEKCRSPLSLIIAHWSGVRPAASAFRLGLDHGVYCVGCCWALMLLMFLVGAGNIGWMLTLGAVMAMEKNFTWGARLAKPLGSSLILSGLVVLLW